MNLPRKAARKKRKVHPIQPDWLMGPDTERDTAADPERQTPQYRGIVRARRTQAGDRCEARLEGCTDQGVDPHHIYPVGEGGATIVPVCWLRWVCRPCHGIIHSANGREEAEERGLIVPKQPKLPI